MIFWNLENSEKLCVFNNFGILITKVLVTDDEKFIISCDIREGILTWDVNNLDEVSGFLYQEDAEEWLNENRIDLNEVRQYLKA